MTYTALLTADTDDLKQLLSNGKSYTVPLSNFEGLGPIY